MSHCLEKDAAQTTTAPTTENQKPTVRDSGIYASSDCLQTLKETDITETIPVISVSAPSSLKRHTAIRNKQKQEETSSKFYVIADKPTERNETVPRQNSKTKTDKKAEVSTKISSSKAKSDQPVLTGKKSSSLKSKASKAKPLKEHTKELRMSVSLAEDINVLQGTIGCKALVDQKPTKGRIKDENPQDEDSVFVSETRATQKSKEAKKCLLMQKDAGKNLSDSNYNYREVPLRQNFKSATLPRPPSDAKRHASQSETSQQSRVRSIIETFQGLKRGKALVAIPSSVQTNVTSSPVSREVECAIQQKLNDEKIDITREPYTMPKVRQFNRNLFNL